MALTERAQADVELKLAGLQERHGSLDKVKCDAAYAEAFPDAVDLHEWRRLFAQARHAEHKPETGPASDATSEDPPASRKPNGTRRGGK